MTDPTTGSVRRIGFFGPFGTFTQQALRTIESPDAAEHVPFRTVPDVLDAVQSGVVDAGFVPIENSIEGMVNFTQDALAFDHDLIITNEVVIDIEHCLLVRPDASLDDVTTLLSIPVATAQCHRYLRDRMPDVEIVPASSTADAARRVAESDDPTVAALAPRVAAEVYGLDIAESDIADHAGNQTRFVMVARSGVSAPTGHDRTALVVYQRADEPGSLIAILQEFAARRINLSNLFSRPTKAGGLGDYCFIIYADGHVTDELVADTMRSLHAKQGGVKFLGSYPAAGESAATEREHVGGRWREADDWLADIRADVAR
ncbi:MAG: prephenate dehydratase [Ilumatobacter sp.]|uniref:prephenate dehydratase n=1 Tax=Ilumatobacter sp. TaxID=1967498 RepID=UPI00329789FC